MRRPSLLSVFASLSLPLSFALSFASLLASAGCGATRPAPQVVEPAPQASASSSASAAPEPSSTAAPSAAASSSASTSVDAGPTCALTNGASWEGCEGKTVRVAGRVPKMIMQHPVVTGGPSAKGGVQDYMDVDGGGQIILVVDAPVACKGAMTATGVLRSVRGRGAPGTKESYEGWYLASARVTCR